MDGSFFYIKNMKQLIITWSNGSGGMSVEKLGPLVAAEALLKRK